MVEKEEQEDIDEELEGNNVSGGNVNEDNKEQGDSGEQVIIEEEQEQDNSGDEQEETGFIHSRNNDFFQEEFYPTANFVAPVLEQDESVFEENFNLEDSIQTAPSINTQDNKDFNYISGELKDAYSLSNDYDNENKTYETDSSSRGIRPIGLLTESDISGMGGGRQDNVGFLNAGIRGTGRTMQTDEMKNFQTFEKSQEEYRHKLDQDTSPIFKRKRGLNRPV